MEKTIKTLLWTDGCLSLFKKCARLAKLGSAQNRKPKNFVEFFAAYPNADVQSLLGCVRLIGKYAGFVSDDVTHVTTFTEDACLFSTEGDAAGALDVIICHLEGLGRGQRVPSLWCFLDEERKAVVHFVNKHGYYAELYCRCNENSSALHFVTQDEQGYVIPVVFVQEDLFESFWSSADACGGYCLRDYLPRVKGDLLSKKKHKPRGLPLENNDGRGARYHDDWDTL